MNIWIFNHYAVPMEYYPHGRVHWFAKYLRQYGHTVTVFAASTVHNSDINLIETEDKYKCMTINDVQYVYLKTSLYEGNGRSRVFNMFQYMFALLKTAKNFPRPDKILAMSVHPLTCVAGIRLARKYKIQCVVDIADLWPESLKVYGILKRNSLILKFLYLGEKWIYKHANAIIFTMEGGKKYIQDRGWKKDIREEKIFNINNGIDLKEFDYNAVNYKLDDPDLEDDTKLKVVYTGAIRAANNIKTLVDVADIAQKQGKSEMLFLVYGSGNEKEQLIKYCKEHKIYNIRFKNKVDKKFIPYILQKADVNVWHFIDNDILRYGGSPNKLFEYLAAGRPILSTNRIHYNLVKRYNAGIVNEVGTPENIYESLVRFMDMPRKVREDMGHNARKAVYRYDFSELTKQLEEIIVKS